MDIDIANLTDAQKAELAITAINLIKFRKWRELAWEEACNGKYPDPVGKQEADEEYQALVQKYLRIKNLGLLAEETSTHKEHYRLIALEFCDTVQI